MSLGAVRARKVGEGQANQNNTEHFTSAFRALLVITGACAFTKPSF